MSSRMLFSAVLLTCASTVSAQPTSDNAKPLVVELFQSQDCSSCPPADAHLNAIAGNADILALSYGVTYWDSLGWKDTFAKQAYIDRQYM